MGRKPVMCYNCLLYTSWFPDLKIGGCALCSVWNRTFINGFLSEVARTNAPLDFFSWHWYGDSPEQLRDTVIQVKSDLAAHSLTGAESICDEWNYMRDVYKRQAVSLRP